MAKVLFSTNTYWKDLDYLSKGGFVYKALLNNYSFAARWIIINNVPDELTAQRVFSGVTDNIILESEMGSRALRYFGLPSDIFVDKKTDVDGYKYSIDSVIELAMAKDFDYICHYCGDTELYKKANWIDEGIKKIEEEGYAGARPRLPRYDLQKEGEQEMTETDVFSDHVYLIPVAPYRKDLKTIFSLTEPSCDDIHVKYGGNSFERCLTRYLKYTHQKLAIIQSAEEIPIRL